MKDLILKSNILLAKPVSSPMTNSMKLSKFDNPELDDGTMYKSIVGDL